MTGSLRRTAAPHPAVRGLVYPPGYGGTEETVDVGGLLVPAEPSVSIVVNLTEPDTGPDAFVTPAGRPCVVPGTTARPRSWITVHLTPPGAYRLLGPGAAETRGEAVDLTELLGHRAHDLVAALRAAGEWRHRWPILDRLLADASGPAPAPELDRVWRRICQTGGRVPMAGLAAEVGWSRQHLSRRFGRHFGSAPKTFARLVRLNRVLRRIRREGRWEQAAFDAGYFDQSHLARDLREFTGTTLGRYLERAQPCGCVREANSLQAGPPGTGLTSPHRPAPERTRR
ncbi:helix-turn-helix domain-containing protein [Phytomonospora endophytica]|uniref:AraC-like DNA-binding protein n=1 Tax=Phytomonospora endophytica TaxID=714109 RepID=A0A841FBK1_9ACTN|nr:helix-turn-helix domain-containing protein [Phytomonospora endophytica]MBB6032715.1 AraC-like DNA-binding protein [Phytomonospora endophytica]GIG66136.1 AraC family transcriptional regulator [Phytomonospora endophytica]